MSDEPKKKRRFPAVLDLTSKAQEAAKVAAHPSPPVEEHAGTDEGLDTSVDALPASIQAAVRSAGWPGLMPVQARTLPYMREGRDLIVQSKTGSGKTGAFLLPLFEALDPAVRGAQALVLTPTRELAKQIYDEFLRLKGDRAEAEGLDAVLVYGGVGYGEQTAGLKGGAQLVIGTPGRILDHLERRTLVLDRLKVLVLDEADEMLSMGFLPAMNKLRRYLPDQRQSTMFSATMPPLVRRLAETFLTDPAHLSLAGGSVQIDALAHRYYVVPGMGKDRTLVRLIELENPDTAILFANTKREVEYLAQFLRNYGHDAGELSGDLNQGAREAIMQRLRDGNLRFLVATDVAARGIDISDLSHVIQYDVPQDPEYYVHRAGRTARAGKTGVSITLTSEEDKNKLLAIARRYDLDFEERPLPTDEEVAERVRERLTTVLEDRYREMRTLARERAGRFDALVASLAAEEPHLLSMLLDGLYHDSLHAKPQEELNTLAARRAQERRERDWDDDRGRGRGRGPDRRDERRGRRPEGGDAPRAADDERPSSDARRSDDDGARREASADADRADAPRPFHDATAEPHEAAPAPFEGDARDGGRRKNRRRGDRRDDRGQDTAAEDDRAPGAPAEPDVLPASDASEQDAFASDAPVDAPALGDEPDARSESESATSDERRRRRGRGRGRGHAGDAATPRMPEDAPHRTPEEGEGGWETPQADAADAAPGTVTSGPGRLPTSTSPDSIPPRFSAGDGDGADHASDEAEMPAASHDESPAERWETMPADASEGAAVRKAKPVRPAKKSSGPYSVFDLRALSDDALRAAGEDLLDELPEDRMDLLYAILDAQAVRESAGRGRRGKAEKPSGRNGRRDRSSDKRSEGRGDAAKTPRTDGGRAARAEAPKEARADARSEQPRAETADALAPADARGDKSRRSRGRRRRKADAPSLVPLAPTGADLLPPPPPLLSPAPAAEPARTPDAADAAPAAPRRARGKKADSAVPTPTETADAGAPAPAPRRARAKKADAVDAPSAEASAPPAAAPARTRAKKAASADAPAAAPAVTASDAPAAPATPTRSRAKKAAASSDGDTPPAADAPAPRTRAKKAAAADVPVAEDAPKPSRTRAKKSTD